MTAPSLPQNPQLVPYLYVLNRLLLKASAVKTTEELAFLIVNDTIHLLPYSRAFLFNYSENRPKLIAASGQANLNDDSPLVKTAQHLISGLNDPGEVRVLKDTDFSEQHREAWGVYQKENQSSILWLPIFAEHKQVLGLWLEQLESKTFAVPIPEMIVLLKDFLMHGYGIAWERVGRKYSARNWFGLTKNKLMYLLIPLLASLFLIRIPLRVAAPCEIVSSDLYLIRAPLAGVIKEVVVLPGAAVKKEDPLVVYDPSKLEHALKSSAEDVQEKKGAVDRAAILGQQDRQLLNELNLLNIKLQKEKLNLDFATYEASLLTIKSPQDGVVIIDSPEDWRGRPVVVGEKIMAIGNLDKTQVKIWIPEADNVPLDIEKTIKVYFYVSPAHSYDCKIRYIANEVTLSEREIPSFVAKADWVDHPPEDQKLGLRGTAILYGKPVSLFYYIIRKPWFTFRNFIGF